MTTLGPSTVANSLCSMSRPLATTYMTRGGEWFESVRPSDTVPSHELLELLLERRPAAVFKQQIRDRLWPDSQNVRARCEARYACCDRAFRPCL